MVIDERLGVFIDSLSWNIPQYLKEAEKKAASENVPVIKRPVQTLLGFLLRFASPDAILEIGTATGFSSMLISEYASQAATIDTIEKVPARIKGALENYKKYNKETRINLIQGDASEVLETLVAQKKLYGFVFMDAAKGQYMNFAGPVYRLLKDRGILVTDNVLKDGEIIQSRYAVTRRDRTIHGRMRSYLYYLTHSGDFDTVILPVGDGVAVSVKNPG
ncbi:MAG TPA: O-methyltransferase [Lachnospiraceae bacterium]|nr:O-methyltransferase [Lachnospiraceae bacterium]